MPLTIYTASAGAGKTHTLTGEFIRLLFSDNRTDGFRRIQAVTFTNKATNEMKERILQELVTLTNNPEDSPYIAELKNDGNSAEDIRKRARKLLAGILNDYGCLRVKTIDAFFQEVIRSFVRELKLNADFRVQLDQDLMLDRAVLRLLTDLDTVKEDGSASNPDLAKWVASVAEEVQAEGEGHNIRRTLGKLGKELFREETIELIDNKAMPSRQVIGKLKAALKHQKEDFRARVMPLADAALDVVTNCGCRAADFFQGNNGPVAGLIRMAESNEIKLPTSHFYTVRDKHIDAEQLLGRESKKQTATNPELLKAASDLRSIIIDYISHFEPDPQGYNAYKSYASATEAIMFIDQYGILGEIYDRLEKISSEESSMLISSAGSLVSRIIGKDEQGHPFSTPYIYERLGARLEHHMIDEFQDTSRLQYGNFCPLLKESLDNRHYNLVVGDVKQSIYRFRNADRNILGRDLDTRMAAYAPQHIDLADNWRSSPEVIAFNNALFAPTEATGSEALLPSLFRENIAKDCEIDPADLQDITDTYKAPPQGCPRKSEAGNVFIHDMPTPENTGNDSAASDEEQDREKLKASEEYGLRVAATLPRVVLDLQRRGYRPTDIAILVSENKEAAWMAEALLAAEVHCPDGYSLRPVSDEALRISSSPAVRFLINALRYIANPNDMFYAGALRQTFIRLLAENSETETFDQEILPVFAKLADIGLYEICTEITDRISPYVQPGEWAFVIALLDMVNNHTLFRHADASAFLRYWDETGHRKCISAANDENAIRILTIHKSKGLGFPVVLIPLPTWGVLPSAQHRPVLWCRTDTWFDSSGIELPSPIELVPVKYKKALTNTFFSGKYIGETQDMAIDKLNQLYVAFTRAKRELHLWMPPLKEKKTKRQSTGITGNISETLEAAFCNEAVKPLAKRNPAAAPLSEKPDAEDFPLPSGTLDKDPGKKSRIRLSFDAQDAGKRINTDSPLLSKRLRLRRSGALTLAREEAIAHGAAMHAILENIDTIHNLEKGLDTAIARGLISPKEKRNLSKILASILSEKPQARWFDGSATPLNESEIIDPEHARSYRPDRILFFPDGQVEIVDYKFGQPNEAHHRRQLRGYIRLLRDMGYGNVRGYIWYIQNGVVTPVD